MFIVFFRRQVVPVLNTIAPDMSAQKGKRVVADTVVRRRTEEVVAEMAEIAKEEKRRMTAQAAQALQAPRRIEMVAYSRLRPVRLSQPINPAPTPQPEQLRVAAVRRRECDEEERRFIDGLEDRIGRPRTPTPPRTGTDPYGFAQWAQRRY